MKKLAVLCLCVLSFSACKVNKKQQSDSNAISKPNIIVVYLDDLGYGDVSAYGAKELITPNFDRIAKNGIRFTNGYASSPTCTPSRYALLSGQYPFRKQKAKILKGNAPLLFDIDKQTLPSMLHDAGYFTGVIGKWHLGLGNEAMDWNGEISPGPRAIGFDYSYIMASTNDRVPSVYVQNEAVVNLDPKDPIAVSYKENFEGQVTGKTHPELLKMHPSHGHNKTIHNGISRIGYMKGGNSARFIDEDMSDDFLKETLAFVDTHKDEPFFLFYSLHQPHVPRVPHPRFAGTSGLGPRGDVILEADWAVGQLLDKLKALSLDKNTIIVFSSDNGPVLDDGYHDDAVEKNGDHTPKGGLRGGKYSLFEAGSHVPFMVSWPDTVKPGVSDALVCQMDLLASFAGMLNQPLELTDSENILDALLGKSNQGRESLILGQNGLTTYRKGNWAFIPPHKGWKLNKQVNIETGRDKNMQLFDLSADRGQLKNVAKDHPELIETFSAEIEAIVNKK